MLHKILIPLFVMCVLFSNHYLMAQAISNVDVQSLNDQQIESILNEVSSRGLSIGQAAEIAKARGATQSQIDQLTRRIQELNFAKGQSVSNPKATVQQGTSNTRESFSMKIEAKASGKAKKVFGFQLFNSENLTFEPSVNIPTPKNYVLGINDELLINVWGASQKTYQLTIGQDGAIIIPDIGPIYLLGVGFEDARNLIKRRLISIYSGMGGDNPNTYAEVSISNLRSIKINIIGEVLAPGTYTLPATASAFNALYLSGGPNENGSFRGIQVIRDNKVIREIDVYDFLINANSIGNIQLREQDIIFIRTYKKRVEVIGAFKRNGFFEMKGNESLENMIEYAGGFTDIAFRGQLSVTRVTSTERKVIDVAQKDYATFELENGDKIKAGTVIDRYENRVSIEGAVFRPGTYALTPGMSLSQLIQEAQGVREDYYNNRGMLIRLNEDLTPMSIPFEINNVLNGVDDILLQREDKVIIKDIFSMRENRFVRVYGEVQSPGQYAYNENMSLKDLIFTAGGFTEAASESFVEVSRRHDYETASKPNNMMVELFQFDVGRGLMLDKEGENFLLNPFDYVYIRKAPSYFRQKTVTISGEVKYPGDYSIISKNERISGLVKRAGGLTPYAFLKGAIIYRSNNIIPQSKSIIQNIASDSTVVKAVHNLTNNNMELRLEAILKNPGSVYDYYLKEGDHIYIPETSQEVRVSGEVLNPLGLAYEEGRSMNYFISRSGGFSTKAKKGKVFVIYRDGTTKITRNYLFHNYPPIEPGCQIVVPIKPEKSKPDNTAKWLAVSSTLSTILVAITAILR